MRAPLFLFRVEWASRVPNRGVLLSPGVNPEMRRTLKEGDTIELRRPDGITSTAKIRAFYFVDKTKEFTNNLNYDILISIDSQKEDAPPGTEVWLDGNGE